MSKININSIAPKKYVIILNLMGIVVIHIIKLVMLYFLYSLSNNSTVRYFKKEIFEE